METTFISIHDLSLDARLLYVSSSVTDILGYSPQEIVGKSCWEYFHPDEIPFARAIHGRGVQLDKAAVLNYCKIRDKQGYWVGCECVFTIVHDVLVASTSIYRRGTKSLKRATEAPIIRRLFSSSPQDPRYHMLTHISAKFSQPTKALAHEPRAALFLNRFTRTLTIMYATNGLSDLLGMSADELNGKSFYYCIQENCLQEAVKCLESAKANDSIAYLRFWFRDPRIDFATDHDDAMSESHSSDDDDGGVDLNTRMDTDSSDYHSPSDHSYSKSRSSAEGGGASILQNGTANGHRASMEPNSRSSSGNSTDLGDSAADFMFDEPPTAHSSSSETSLGSTGHLRNLSGQPVQSRGRQIELEAVVSCTSDGLVVILRAARPFLSHTIRPSHQAAEPVYTNGLFASPWAEQPILPQTHQHNGHNYRPYQPSPDPPTAMVSGPHTNDFMQSIREVAVFAWALTGINGSLDQYSRGTASGESQPPGGLPVWDPHNNAGSRRESFKGRDVGSGRVDPSPYWPHMERNGVEAWDAQSRVRHWSGTQNLLSMAPPTLSPLQRQEELAAAAVRRTLWR
ncbi:hypothetical protein MMC15_000145 [Xylographa vitiligo]|nr:hypothetical protein [Xylographa vitiligo]